MCGPSAPPKAPPPIPAQAPPPLAILQTEDTKKGTASALSANRARSSLRIDRTQNTPGKAGSGLNIPT